MSNDVVNPDNHICQHCKGAGVISSPKWVEYFKARSNGDKPEQPKEPEEFGCTECGGSGITDKLLLRVLERIAKAQVDRFAQAKLLQAQLEITAKNAARSVCENFVEQSEVRQLVDDVFAKRLDGVPLQTTTQIHNSFIAVHRALEKCQNRPMSCQTCETLAKRQSAFELRWQALEAKVTKLEAFLYGLEKTKRAKKKQQSKKTAVKKTNPPKGNRRA